MSCSQFRPSDKNYIKPEVDFNLLGTLALNLWNSYSLYLFVIIKKMLRIPLHLSQQSSSSLIIKKR